MSRRQDAGEPLVLDAMKGGGHGGDATAAAPAASSPDQAISRLIQKAEDSAAAPVYGRDA